MKIFLDILIFLIFAAIIVIGIIRLRKRLLQLWTEVSQHEVSFYKRLEETLELFYKNREIISSEDNNDFIRKISRYKRKKLRSLLLRERQDLFSAIHIIYNEIEDLDEEQYKPLKEKFNQLQKERRIYNSKVLIYNQTISVFPTRYLALRMNLELKEYFG